MERDGAGGSSSSVCGLRVCVCVFVVAGRVVAGGFVRVRWTEPRIFAVPQTVCPSRRKNRLPLINPTNGRLVLAGSSRTPAGAPQACANERPSAALGRDTGTWVALGPPARACRGPARTCSALQSRDVPTVPNRSSPY